MPAHKLQQFVPRCHLKPFSLDGAGKAINLYYIPKGRLIRNAAVKGQCAKDYFYGENLVIEKALQAPEGRYASILNQALVERSIEHRELAFLTRFCLLQHLRTDCAAKRHLLAQTELADLIFEGVSKEQQPPPLTQKQVVQFAIKAFTDSAHLVSDLKPCLLHNTTTMNFVTSDDPAALINRFYSQRLGPRWKSFGLKNAGAIFVLPLSPQFALAAFDGDIYTCPDKEKNIVRLTDTRDISAINALQFIKASESIYFSDWADGPQVEDAFKSVANSRPTTWHEIHYAVKEDTPETEGHQRFRVVHSKEDRLAADEALLHLESRMLDPKTWCSKIKFRNKLKFVNTDSGAGYVRMNHAS